MFGLKSTDAGRSIDWDRTSVDYARYRPGIIPLMPRWAEADFNLTAMFWYDEPVAFTRAGRRGRIRACRGIGATLSEAEVARFDAALDAMLREAGGETFDILHRIDAHILRPKQTGESCPP